MATVRLEGEANFHAVVAMTKKLVEKNADTTVSDAIQRVFAQSQYLVPKRTLRLMESGRVEGPKKFGKEISYEIKYGGMSVRGATVDYAIYVHEDPTKKHAPPTTYKFVDIPFRALEARATQVFGRGAWRGVEALWRNG